MNKFNFISVKKYSFHVFVALSILVVIQPSVAGVKNYLQKPDSLFNSYKGVVTDINTREKLPYASLTVESTNTSTVTNADGEFLLKVPKTDTDRMLVVTFMGYGSQRISLTSMLPEGNKIELKSLPIYLPELKVISKDPEAVVQ